ncbi:cation diffusion facilitator family transporter [Autumnicola psychrophila]|uniref:Cation diffusion facilitator family transporter n=1 Tax=Autumnicola psychrophila TaxID=3075592 RepID=A0ABU3DRA8_9FLAO|nr:cation diffusion facilitator family transporter [Zunongwangia sp. F225]MDT0686158.1 cation diffusion facilitator family transporter [Zunongwangia sp. F225]
MESKKQVAIRTTYFSILGNVLLALVKGITGIFGNSYALIADAIESTTDVFSSVLVLFGIRYSTKPADENHPYGHGKAEPLITFAVVGFLLVSATIIAYESIINIQTPHKIPERYTLIVLGIIVIIKELFYRFVSKKSDATNSTSLKADAWHHRSDAITSLMAFVGISIAVYMGKGYETADDWAALLASGFIVYNAFLIFRPALSEIMDEHLYDDFIDDIKTISDSVDGVIAIEKCFVRKAGLFFHIDLHLIVKGDITVTKGHAIAHNLKNELQEKFPEISDVLIHVEPDQQYVLK